MRWNSRFKFVAGINLGPGATGSSVPFHDSRNSVRTSTRGRTTPDDDVFQHLVASLDTNNTAAKGSCQVKIA